jgi:hypothetical protein
VVGQEGRIKAGRHASGPAPGMSAARAPCVSPVLLLGSGLRDAGAARLGPARCPHNRARYLCKECSGCTDHVAGERASVSISAYGANTRSAGGSQSASISARAANVQSAHSSDRRLSLQSARVVVKDKSFQYETQDDDNFEVDC